MLTHHGMLAHARNVAATQNLGPGARVQVAMPLFHVGGTSYTPVAWAAGAPIFLMRLPFSAGHDAAGGRHDGAKRRRHAAAPG